MGLYDYDAARIAADAGVLLVRHGPLAAGVLDARDADARVYGVTAGSGFGATSRGDDAGGGLFGVIHVFAELR